MRPAPIAILRRIVEALDLESSTWPDELGAALVEARALLARPVRPAEPDIEVTFRELAERARRSAESAESPIDRAMALGAADAYDEAARRLAQRDAQGF